MIERLLGVVIKNPGAKSRNGPRTPPKVYKAMPNFLIPNLTGIKPYVYYSMANLLCREADVYESLSLSEQVKK